MRPEPLVRPRTAGAGLRLQPSSSNPPRDSEPNATAAARLKEGAPLKSRLTDPTATIEPEELGIKRQPPQVQRGWGVKEETLLSTFGRRGKTMEGKRWAAEKPKPVAGGGGEDDR